MPAQGDRLGIVGLEAGSDVANRAGRQRQTVIDGDVRTGELAVAGDRQLVGMQGARPMEAVVVVIPDRQLPGIQGRAVEVEHGPLGEGQGVETIGLPRCQGHHATVAAPRRISVVPGCGGDGAIAGQIVLAAIGGKASRIGRKCIGILDEGHTAEGAGQGTADVAVGVPGAPVPVTAAVAVGVWLDALAEEGVTGSHGRADDLALIGHAQHTGCGVALHREEEGGGALIGPQCRDRAQQHGEQHGGPERRAGRHG
ncbi:hypothetical protein D3C78_647460 [compost metagenome]